MAPQSPGHDVGHPLQGVGEHGQVEAADHTAGLEDHVGQLLPQGVEGLLVPPFPAGPVLVAVDVEGEAEQIRPASGPPPAGVRPTHS